MSPLTSANWESFYNSFFHEKRTVSRGIEPMTSNLKLSTQCTEPSSHVKSISLTLSQILRFLDKPTNHFFCLGWWQPPWSTYSWVSSWIPAMNLWRSANLLLYRSFYNSFLYKKSSTSFGLEPQASNPQHRTLSTESPSHVQGKSLRLSHYLEFLDLSISQCLGSFMRGRKFIIFIFNF